jgi:hypothetical protein
MNRLPIELVHMIYRMYFPWVMEELLVRQSQKNDFIVRTTKSNKLVTEVDAQFGVLYLNESQISKWYRRGVPALPLELEQVYLAESPTPNGCGYVSPYIRRIVERMVL